MNITLIASAMAMQLFPGLVPPVEHINPNACGVLTSPAPIEVQLQSLDPPEYIVGETEVDGTKVVLSVSEAGLTYTIFIVFENDEGQKVFCVLEQEKDVENADL